MKRLLFIALMACISATSFAQLGKMQYEDAEEQFAAGKFKEALILLDESEKTMGKSNPMIEHLRIMARTELLKKDLAANIDHLEIARKEVKAFLVTYDGDARIEDKYREVYKASKTLAEFPSMEELEKKAAEAKQMEEEKKQEDAENLMPGYRDGMTAAEAKKLPNYHAQHSTDTLQLLMYNNFQQMVFVSPKTGYSFGYIMNYQFAKSDKECTEAFSVYNEKKAEITRLLGVEPVDTKPSGPDLSAGNSKALMRLATALAEQNIQRCQWTKGTKTIILTIACQQYKRTTTAQVAITSENTKFK